MQINYNNFKAICYYIPAHVNLLSLTHRNEEVNDLSFMAGVKYLTGNVYVDLIT